ncbi:hypothetical protein ACI4X4_001678 [Campylobacter upsaliensis]
MGIQRKGGDGGKKELKCFSLRLTPLYY